MLVGIHLHNGVLGHQQLKRKCDTIFTYEGHSTYIDYKDT